MDILFINIIRKNHKIVIMYMICTHVKLSVLKGKIVGGREGYWAAPCSSFILKVCVLSITMTIYP